MEGLAMRDLPSIVKQEHLRFYWKYRDTEGKIFALVARYEESSHKKWFHQYHLKNENWTEGAPTPLPLFGMHTLPHSDQTVYIFEGEKCTEAAHHLDLCALTSMMGASQAHHADWSILSQYSNIKRFILIPDHDEAGKKYMQTVFQEVQKTCPMAEIWICELPSKEKGGDLVDWIQNQPYCLPDWDGFSPIDEPHHAYLRQAFNCHVEANKILAMDYFYSLNDKALFQGEPEPIEDILSPVLPCPIETLSGCLIQWMEALANQMQIPVDYLAAPFLVYLGSLIGRKRALHLRPGTHWTEHANLWGMIIGRPSAMKSPAMQAVKKPLLALAERANEEYKLALEQFRKDQEAWELRSKVNKEIYKENYKSAIKNKKQAPAEYQIEEEPKQPKRKRYKTEDPTIEKLGELLIDSPQGLLLSRDELSGWLNSFDKNDRSNDRQFFLESWSGKEDVDVDRISRGSLHVPAVCLSIFGSIQPGPLSSYIRSSIKGGIGDDGLIQRFQMMVWPDVKPNWQLVKETNIEELEQPIHQLFEYLDKMPFDGKPLTLTFTEDAQALFDFWQEKHENRMRKGNLPPHMEAHLTKYKKLLAALCLILEHANCQGGDYSNQVNKKSLESALAWLDYLESHAWRIYGSSASVVPKAAKDLVERIKSGEIQALFTARDVYHKHHWSGLATSEEVEEVIAYLIEKNYLAKEMTKTNGRPSVKYWVHPKIFKN